MRRQRIRLPETTSDKKLECPPEEDAQLFRRSIMTGGLSFLGICASNKHISHGEHRIRIAVIILLRLRRIKL